MFDAANTALKKIQEFIKRIGDVEKDNEKQDRRLEKAEGEITNLKGTLAVMHKELAHTGKVQDHQAEVMHGLEDRISALETANKILKSEKHGMAIQRGKEKAAKEKLAAMLSATKKSASKGFSAKAKH